MKTRFLFGCILLFCCLFPTLRAQDTEFWFVSPQFTDYSGHNYPAFLAISNGAFQEAHVRITLYNGTGDSIVATPTIAAESLHRYDFPTLEAMATIQNPRSEAGSVTEFGVHITSDVKVTAYYMLNSGGSRDIFTLKGRQALGTQFYVPMQSDNAAPTNSGFTGACDQIDIVATEDDTQVTVLPKAAIVNTSGTGSNPSLAGESVVRTLNRGETLKIMESQINCIPSLAGTSITSTKPIAVTVTEDMVGGGDTSGDQIVPVASLGTHYVVPRGYMSNTSLERFYLVGAVDGTTVDIYTSGSSPETVSLNAGDAYRYPSFPTGVDAIYIEANEPVYVYQHTGYGEEGAALLPSIYAIGQTQLSFYQISSSVQKGFLIFRTDAENGFRIKYGSEPFADLTLSPLDIPNVADWKIARFDFSAAPSARIVTVESTQSAFSLGYITGEVLINDSYGYFSAFGTFEFPAITYMCGSSVTLQGGYAMSYKWSFNGEVISTEPSIVATQEGEYTLVMNQDPNNIEAKTTVQKVNAGTISPAEQVICPGDTPPTPQLNVSGALELTGAQYQWQYSHDNVTWTNIPSNATSPAYTIPGPLTQTTWYRRGMTSESCAVYTYAAKVRVSSCTLPVNPHLMIRYK